MTEQKAMEEFNLLKNTRIFIPHNNTIDVAINALDKQIPKAPTQLDKWGEIFQCPRCNGFVTDYFGCRMAYCWSCGQAIKWEIKEQDNK